MMVDQVVLVSYTVATSNYSDLYANKPAHDAGLVLL